MTRTPWLDTAPGLDGIRSADSRVSEWYATGQARPGPPGGRAAGIAGRGSVLQSTDASHCSTLAMCTVDQDFPLGMRTEAVQQSAEALDLLLADALRRHGRGRRLQDPPDLQELQHRPVTMEIDDKTERLQQEGRLQAGHVGAVAAPHIQNVDQRQCLDRLTQGTAREP